MAAKEIKLKEIQFNDVYEFAEVIKTLELDFTQEELTQLQGSQIKSGIQVAKKLIGNLKGSKKHLNQFLGHMFGMSGDEFGKLGIKDMTVAFKQLEELKKSGELVDFINAARGLIS